MESRNVGKQINMWKKTGIIFVCLIMLFMSCIPVFAKDKSEREEIRVGFFAHDGYHVQDDKGVKSGYGYEFLKMAENYNNWKYEYVGYDKGWGDMLELLDEGKIDLVTFAQKTPERLEKYDFSTNPIGTGSIILTARKGDERYQVGDCNSYNGMRIGILKNTTHDKMFEEYAKKNGISFTPVYYDNTEAILNDLQEGSKIDAMLNSSLRTLHNEKVLEEMDPVDFYVIVKKGNVKLLNEVNQSIAQLDMNVPGWRLNLKNKYFSLEDSESLILNKEELKYLEQLKESKEVLKVASNPDLAPYSYVENGKMKGIAPEIFEKIAERLDLKYEYITLDSYEEYNKLIKNGEADIDLTCFSDYGLAEYHGVVISNPYMSTTLALLSLDNNSGKLKSLAELRGSENNTTYSQQLYTVKRQIYNTNQECIDAVVTGKVDGTYLYTYTAQQAVEKDFKNHLTYSIMPEYSINISMGVNENRDYRLISIIDEAIKTVKGNDVQRIIQNEIAQIKEERSLQALLYDYPEVSLGILGILLIVIFIICFYIYKSRNAHKEHLQAMELSRFMGYVCEANEMVMEINLNTREYAIHNMENGVLVSKKIPYSKEGAKVFSNIFLPEDLERLRNELDINSFLEIFGKAEKGLDFEARAKAKDGAYRWYAYTIRSIPKSKNYPNNYIIFKRDIDEVNRKKEEQRQALEDALETARNASSAKGQFLSRMSHEIRTPLNAVIGYMDIAKDATDNMEKMLHCITNSDTAAKHLLSIINDVLDISSIESGKMKIAHSEFDLKKQLTSISSMFFSQAKEKKIRFEVKLKDFTEEWVIGDSLRMNQILMNLLSNAIKFTPEDGSIILSVTQMQNNDNKVYMKFEITDSGIGMSEEYQKKLFQPFEQESAMTAQKYGGTGLGLSICFNLVNMMGGSIDVKSKIEEGTTFTVSLYFDKSKEHKENMDTIQNYSRLRVLVVDDDPGVCEYMKNLFKRCKVKCDIVKDGADAIKQMKRRFHTEYKYDMIIVDWNMPGMNGVEVAKRIKEEFDSELPIIIATAYDVTEFEDQAREAGVEKVISKPLFQSTIFDLLVSNYGKYEPVSATRKEVHDLKGIHILLAEDNEMNMEIAVDILSKAGIIVEQAVNGKEAYEKFTETKEGTYDAILMDIQMPIMDGYQATNAIRNSSHPEAGTIPIIAMTANAFAEDVAAALTSGMNDHISKPIDYDKLFMTLNKVMKKRISH